ncbi:hypothetical protein BZA05DRAFT_442752 [Tricharina praecox]|uniref:uncharacterized protein n=1 Tax=Tricharina praecox TaxID=43433 RepID=UPI00221ECB67|nr:uncharacterized protein BZA05DRAFT_442752 [Tricharina praecox]KAI5856094.1 hypothetical protein BZA05DRAFT_442752 [Tricharina praecox]
MAKTKTIARPAAAATRTSTRIQKNKNKKAASAIIASAIPTTAIPVPPAKRFVGPLPLDPMSPDAKLFRAGCAGGAGISMVICFKIKSKALDAALAKKMSLLEHPDRPGMLIRGGDDSVEAHDVERELKEMRKRAVEQLGGGESCERVAKRLGDMLLAES